MTLRGGKQSCIRQRGTCKKRLWIACGGAVCKCCMKQVPDELRVKAKSDFDYQVQESQYIESWSTDSLYKTKILLFDSLTHEYFITPLEAQI